MDLAVENERLKLALADAQRALDTERRRAETAEAAARRLQAELDLLRRKLVGPSSERMLDPNQLALPIQGAPAPAAEPERTEPPAPPKAPPRKRVGGNRRRVEDMDHLRTVVHHQVHDPKCPCGCGAPGVLIGQDVSWRLDRVPAEIVRHKNVRDRFAFPEHRERGAADTPATVWTAPEPYLYALPGALCGDGLLVAVAIDKYCDHLPLYRQSQRFEREGLELSRQTLCDWMMALGELLRPIVKVLTTEILAQTWLRADATGLPVMDEGRTKGHAHHGHLWAIGNYDSVVFSYTPDKKATTVAALFLGFQGVVVIDGATDFNLLESRAGVTRAGCWAHARRLLFDALQTDAVLATRGLAAIRELFVVERAVMAAPEDERLALRDELCNPILAGIRTWVDEELPGAVPGMPMRRALGYLDTSGRDSACSWSTLASRAT